MKATFLEGQNAKIITSQETIASVSQSSLLENLGIEATVAASALTVAIKQKDGSTDATVRNPIRVAFQGSTAADGDLSVNETTASSSLTVASTATLGTASGEDHFIYFYAIDNAGTTEPAISLSLFDEGTLVSTVALTTGSDDASVLYSTTLRSNVSVRLLGRMLTNQATAGTWALAPTEVSLIPFIHLSPFAIAESTSGQTLTTAVLTIVDYSTIITDSHNRITTGASWNYACPEAGVYSIMGTVEFQDSGNWSVGETLRLEAVVNGALIGRMDFEEQQVTGAFVKFLSGAVKFNCAVDDLIDIRAFQGSGANLSLTTTALRNRVYIAKVGEL